MEQSEGGSNNNYIVCTRCHTKFINDEEHIKTDFGYNTLSIRYNNCVKCRTCNREKSRI